MSQRFFSQIRKKNRSSGRFFPKPIFRLSQRSIMEMRLICTQLIAGSNPAVGSAITRDVAKKQS